MRIKRGADKAALSDNSFRHLWLSPFRGPTPLGPQVHLTRPCQLWTVLLN